MDVVMLLIDELHVSRRLHSAALSQVGVAVSKQRDEARTRLFEREPANALRRIAKRLGKTADDLQERSSKSADARAWRWAVDARVARRASQLRAAIEHAGAVYLPERLHAVRRALDKLSYSLELAGELNAAGRGKGIAGSATTDVRTLRRGEDILGKMRDLQMVIEHVRETQAAVSPPK